MADQPGATTEPGPNDGPVAVVGTGAIGASWAALFLARGREVVATDPAAGAEERLAADIAAWWPSLERQGLVVDGADPQRWQFAADAAEACADAGFVQENGPERLDVKHELYEAMDAVAGPGVVLASSSSGLKASEIQTACRRHPERVVIGHPFNPPHLVPLVEVVGGVVTSDTAIDDSMAFYRAVGKSPIRINTELPGHVTNRLQAALWREAYWLVDQGVCSVADIDQAIASGPGLRWALLGPFATQHVSGGPGGIAHVLEHLGPPMVDWWETLQTPAWTESLKAKVAAGVDDELTGLDQAEMLAQRDRLLEQLLVAKSGADQLPGPQATEQNTTTTNAKTDKPTGENQ
jgi:3-hydroxyacyl-CoA dehydrogenase